MKKLNEDYDATIYFKEDQTITKDTKQGYNIYKYNKATNVRVRIWNDDIEQFIDLDPKMILSVSEQIRKEESRKIKVEYDGKLPFKPIKMRDMKKDLRNKRWNILLRILVSPLVFAIVLIASLVNAIKICYRHIVFGSELIFYDDKRDYNTISDIYRELKSQNINLK